MQLSDTREILASPSVVWSSLLDADVLRVCIPGCQSLTGSVAAGYEAVVKQKVGPVSATFTGLVTLSEIVEGRSLRISGEGKGGVAGFARGGARVSFEAIPGGTRLSYEAEASVGGKIAQLGSRIIDGLAKKMADDFFARFQAAVEGSGAVAAAGGDAAGAPAAGDAAGPGAGDAAGAAAPRKGWFRRLFGV